MRRTSLLLVTFALLLFCSTSQGQIGRWLQDAANRAAQRTAAEQVEQAVENVVVNITIEGADKPATPALGGEMGLAISDFVPGKNIIFYNDVSRERVGEFPSQWDLLRGSAEIASVNGENALVLVGQTEITPLMETPKNYLPEAFTLEFDFYAPESAIWAWNFCLKTPDGNGDVITLSWTVGARQNSAISTNWKTTSGDSRRSAVSVDLAQGWHRLSLSFNQRALKVYVDGVRVANAPDVAQPGWFMVSTSGSTGRTGTYIRHFRIAEGAMPLSDRVISNPSQTATQPDQPALGVAKDIAGSVEQFLRDQGWPSEKRESPAQDIYVVKLSDRPYTLFYIVRKADKQLVVYATLNETVAKSHRAAVMEYLTQINFNALRVGNLQINLLEGDVQFRVGIDVEHGVINPAVVKQLTFTYAITIADIFFPGVKEIEGGSKPEEVFKRIAN